MQSCVTRIRCGRSGTILGLSRMACYWFIKRGPRFFHQRVQAWFGSHPHARAVVQNRWIVGTWILVEARLDDSHVKQQVTNLWVAFGKLEEVLAKSKAERADMFGLLAWGITYSKRLWEEWMDFVHHMDEETIGAGQSMGLLARREDQFLRLPRDEDEFDVEMYKMCLRKWESVSWEESAKAYGCSDLIVDCGKVLQSSRDRPETVIARGRKRFRPRDLHWADPAKFSRIFQIYRERQMSGTLHPYITRLIVALQANGLQMGTRREQAMEVDGETSESADSGSDFQILKRAHRHAAVASGESSSDEEFDHGFGGKNDNDEDEDWESDGRPLLRKRRNAEGELRTKKTKRRRKK